MPRAHRVRGRAVPHHDRVQPRAQETLDERGRVLVGGEEVGERAQHRAVAEARTLPEQPRRRGRERADLADLKRKARPTRHAKGEEPAAVPPPSPVALARAAE